jgi:chaperonin cofactor prefoldin
LNQVDELKKQIKELECHIETLKRQLEDIQAQCEHQFMTTPLIKTCVKCDLMTAEYY